MKIRMPKPSIGNDYVEVHLPAAQLTAGRTEGIGIRYYGGLAEGGNELIAGSVLVGFLRHQLSGGVTLVNARRLAAERGIDVVETRSARARRFTNLLSLKLHTDEGERWIEGTLVDQSGPRLVLVDGIPIECPLAGALIVILSALVVGLATGAADVVGAVAGGAAGAAGAGVELGTGGAPQPARMLPAASMASPPSRSVTKPPASRMRAIPAAMSQGERPRSQ